MQENNVAKLRLLTEHQVVETYGLGLRQLRNMRMRNTGPAYIKVSGQIGKTGGRVLYRVDAIESWLNNRPCGGEHVIETRPAMAMASREMR